MKIWLLVILMLTDPIKIGKINNLKNQAKLAFQSGDYKTAANHYRALIDSLKVREDEVQLNLAHAYFQLNDTAAARQAYQTTLSSGNPAYRSIGHQQLGTLANRQGRFTEALGEFKQALKANPANEDARYNYELVKRKLEEEKKKKEKQNQEQQQKDPNDQKKEEQKKPGADKDQQQKQNQQNQNQQNKDQQKEQSNEQQQNKEQPKKDEQKDGEQKKDEQQPADQKKQEKEMPPSVKEKLEEMKISEQKARMILEAMKNQEMQYLQQNKRKATRPRDKSKPDW